MNLATFFRQLTLFCYFGLMISLIVWITLGDHSADYPTAAWLIIGVVPLLFPLRGLLHGKPYTYAWTTFLMLLYFSHGIGELYSASNFALFPSLEVLFSLITFVGAITFIRINARLSPEK